ncbi:MAG: hypothetical protein QG604_466 [Candidatus Dependentiae bacterium]|nr:hypothetical protein [Candidatus Dependentiae bacterium]
MKESCCWQWLTIPNALSLLRLFLAPIIVWALFSNAWSLACVLFIVGSITDFLDGYLARKFHVQTIVGQYLDPVADKTFLLATLYALTRVPSAAVAVPAWFIVLVFLREVIIVGGGLVLLGMSMNAKEMRPSLLGKLATVGYMVLILWMFLCYFRGSFFINSFFVVFYGVAGISLMSLLHYCWRSSALIMRK